MELMLVAIAISIMLAFYPIRVKPKDSIVSPTAISSTFEPKLEGRPPLYRGETGSFASLAYDIPANLLPQGDAPREFPDACHMCGSELCPHDFTYCPVCTAEIASKDAPFCPSCGSTRVISTDITSFRLSDSESFPPFTEPPLSEPGTFDDFDFMKTKSDFLRQGNAFSDLALGNSEPASEVFYYEGKRYVAVTYDEILVIRPDY